MVKIGTGKHAKCLYCDVLMDNLAEHIENEHMNDTHTSSYMTQDLMIKMDQMENKITQLQ